ncbi:MAG: methyltransferase domain-containing protein [Maritimibacter sp.]|nr:methyltransferase domain-containing protein [Maritimibacter sp.]
MSHGTTKDWDPGTYARFRDLRLRPALDLMAQIGAVPEGPVVDLGCGDGAVAAALAARFPGHPLIGVDSSRAMLADAGGTGAYARLIEADIAGWTPETPPAVIFSNAALHWLDAHDVLLPRLAALLAPGGVLAVQMPGQSEAPSHALLRGRAEEMFPGRVSAAAARAGAVGMPADYARLLAGFGAVTAWETSYVQPLAPAGAAHPVRRFTEATAMRPFLAALNEEEAGRFLSAYEAELAAAYPAEEDGTVLFPFRRVFFTLTRPR